MTLDDLWSIMSSVNELFVCLLKDNLKDNLKVINELFVLFGLLPVIGLSWFKQQIFCQSNNIYFADDSELPNCIHFAAGKSGGLLLWAITLSISGGCKNDQNLWADVRKESLHDSPPFHGLNIEEIIDLNSGDLVNKLSPLGVLLLLSMFAAQIPDVHGTCFIIWMYLKMGCTSNMDQHCNQRRGKHEALNQWMI